MNRVALITCCDSRIKPEALFKGLELFTIRNVANFVPANSSCETVAALQLAVAGFNIHNLIILGHSDCKGVKMACNTPYPSLKEWLSPIAQIKSKDTNTITKLAIELSYNNLKSYSWCTSRIKIHRCYLNLDDSCMYYSTPEGYRPIHNPSSLI